MKDNELVDIETIAERLRYSVRYMRNNWPQLLQGVRPVKLGANRALRFWWDDIVRLLRQPK